MGSDLVCQVIGKPDRVDFIWSAGSSSFEPFALTGQYLVEFRKLAKQAREKLADVVKDRLNGTEADVRRSSLELARVGYKLYQQIFRPAAGAPQAVAKQARQWLTDTRIRGDVESLEVIVDGPDLLPWNVVYEEPPSEQAFLEGAAGRWEPFWGVRYNLAGGRRVEPLRRLSWIGQPKVLLVVDREIRDGLPTEQKQALETFLAGHKVTLVEDRAGLEGALKAGRPDLIYWLSHAEPTALILDGEAIGPSELIDLLRGGDLEGDRLGGLAFLNACQTIEATESGSFLDTLHDLGLSGLVATEHQTINTFAAPFGIDFLTAFLDRGEPIGLALQKLRAERLPLGLLYGTYCPPGLRVLTKPDEALKTGEAVNLPGIRLRAVAAARGRARSVSSPPLPLPEHPYRSLGMYDREHRALFVGRDDDVLRFSVVLDDPRTRLMLLHGESGVGKSSFLRAGVIPYLEDECVGYRALRRADGVDDPSASLVFVRATGDAVGQVAGAICAACARPFPVDRPNGTRTEVDLPGLLAGQLGGQPATPESLRGAMVDDPALLGRVLTAIAAALPFAPVLILDQAEEIFTLARTDAELRDRRAALDMLRLVNQAEGDFKVIVSLRTEYLGRLVDRLRQGARDIRGVREYLLTDFDAPALAEAIRRPTTRTPIAHAAEIPFDRYGFSYDAGVPEAIAEGLLASRTTRQDSVLPLLQVICTQLYERVRAAGGGPSGPA